MVFACRATRRATVSHVPPLYLTTHCRTSLNINSCLYVLHCAVQLKHHNGFLCLFMPINYNTLGLFQLICYSSKAWTHLMINKHHVFVSAKYKYLFIEDVKNENYICMDTFCSDFSYENIWKVWCQHIYYDCKLLQDVWLTVREMCIETEME